MADNLITEKVERDAVVVPSRQFASQFGDVKIKSFIQISAWNSQVKHIVRIPHNYPPSVEISVIGSAYGSGICRQFNYFGCGSFRGAVLILKVIETAANFGNPVHGIDYRMTSPATPRYDDVSVNSVRGSFGRRRHSSSFIRGFEEDLGIAPQASAKE